MQKTYHFVWSFPLLEQDYYLISQSALCSSVSYVSGNLHFSALLYHTITFFSFTAWIFFSASPLRNGPKPTTKMRYIYHPQSTPSSSYEKAAWAQTLEEENSGIHNILVQDGLEVSAIAEWGHFSRQSRLVSSSSTVWVLCNVRESSRTDIIFVSQRNSLPSQAFCATALPIYLPDITRALCHHHYICRYLLCQQNALPHHFIETNSPSLCKLCPMALSVVGDHDRRLCIAVLENRSKLPHSLQGHQSLLAGPHWDNHRCLIWFKREIHVQQDNSKWFKLPAMLVWQTHSP